MCFTSIFGFCTLSVTFISITVIITLHDYLTRGGADSAQVSELCAIYGHLASSECW